MIHRLIGKEDSLERGELYCAATVGRNNILPSQNTTCQMFGLTEK